MKLPPNPLAGPVTKDESPKVQQSTKIASATTASRQGHGMFAQEEEGGHSYDRHVNATSDDRVEPEQQKPSLNFGDSVR